MKRVLLVESGQFIGGVIHNMFSCMEETTVIETSPKSLKELISAVRHHRPHIIILDDTIHPDYLARLLAYMRICDDIRVVLVHTNSNEVEIYQKQQVPVMRSADFFAML